MTGTMAVSDLVTYNHVIINIKTSVEDDIFFITSIVSSKLFFHINNSLS